MKLLKTYGPKRLGFSRYIKYPLRAAKISISIQFFGFWWPSFTHKKDLTEAAKADGHPIWWIRFAWFQVSYGRWV